MGQSFQSLVVPPRPHLRTGPPNVTVLTNADLAELRRREAETQADITTAQPSTQLAGYIQRCFQEAGNHKTEFITPRLLKCQRQRQGEYEPGVLAEIVRQGGSQQYFNLTETKCSDAEAWIQDVIAPSGDKPWTLKTTPLPALSTDLQNLVVDEATTVLLGVPASQLDPALINQVVMATYDMRLKAEKAEADKRVQRHERKIEDQLAETDFIKTLFEFIHHFCTFPVAFLKGPILRRRRLPVWDGARYAVQWQDVHEYTAPNPHDLFPAPNAATVQDGYLIEQMTFDLRELEQMKGLPGWNGAAIDAVLAESDASPNSAHSGDLMYGAAERARLENRDITDRAGTTHAMVRALDFWGAVQGKVLIEWEMPGVTEPNSYTDIHAVLMGNHVVYAVQNPDPTGQRPYSSASYEPVPNSIWGRAISEKMEDCQYAYTATLRNLMNNLAAASGPMGSLDIHAVLGGEDITDVVPWKMWQYDGSKIPSGTRNPVNFFQPDANVQSLLAVVEYFQSQADERTQIPRFAHGNDELSGAGQTASGLAQLTANAARGIKRVIARIDQYVIQPALQRLFLWNMLFDPDANIKGDATVIARGVLSTLVKEQTRLRQQEFLQATNNPTDMMIVGIEGRARVLREVARNLDMDVEKIVPDDETLAARVQQSLMAQAAVRDENAEAPAAESGAERIMR